MLPLQVMSQNIQHAFGSLITKNKFFLQLGFWSVKLYIEYKNRMWKNFSARSYLYEMNTGHSSCSPHPACSVMRPNTLFLWAIHILYNDSCGTVLSQTLCPSNLFQMILQQLHFVYTLLLYFMYYIIIIFCVHIIIFIFAIAIHVFIVALFVSPETVLKICQISVSPHHHSNIPRLIPSLATAVTTRPRPERLDADLRLTLPLQAAPHSLTSVPMRHYSLRIMQGNAMVILANWVDLVG